MYLLLEPTAWLIVIALSLLGSFGNLALYQVGNQGIDAIRARFPSIKDEQWLRVDEDQDNEVTVIGTVRRSRSGISASIRSWLTGVVEPLQRDQGFVSTGLR